MEPEGDNVTYSTLLCGSNRFWRALPYVHASGSDVYSSVELQYSILSHPP